MVHVTLMHLDRNIVVNIHGVTKISFISVLDTIYLTLIKHHSLDTFDTPDLYGDIKILVISNL